jgi:hypothetical protein
MLRKAGSDIYGIDGVDIQPRWPFRTRVTVVKQMLTHGGDWQTVEKCFTGDVVGTAGDEEGDAYHDAFMHTVLPSEPQPVGDPYASLHPRTFDTSPRVFQVDNVGAIMLRYAFEPHRQSDTQIS